MKMSCEFILPSTTVYSSLGFITCLHYSSSFVVCLFIFAALGTRKKVDNLSCCQFSHLLYYGGVQDRQKQSFCADMIQ